MIYRLIYYSKAKPGIGFQQLKQILTVAQDRNRRSGITGALLFGEGMFLQVLEGTREVLSETFFRISRDFRHSEITLIEMVEIEARDFGAWTMRLIKWPEEKFSEYEQVHYKAFTPHLWSADETMAAINEVIHNAAVEEETFI